MPYVAGMRRALFVLKVRRNTYMHDWRDACHVACNKTQITETQFE